MRMPKIGSLPAVLAACLCLLLSGCEKKGGESGSSAVPSETSGTTLPVVVDKTFKLSYDPTDSLNPYTAATVSNRDLTSLLYEGLTRLDGDWTARLSLAASVNEDDPMRPVFRLRDNLVFSDGSPLTAAEVKLSFDLARKSERYGMLLTGVKSAAVGDDGSIAFELTARQPETLACFSFPIVKDDSASPLGSGRYKSGGALSLAANPHHESEPAITSIVLVDLADSVVPLQALESQQTSFFYTDMSDNTVPLTTSPNTAVRTNQLVFLGINSGRTALKDAAVRRALSLAVNRDALSASTYDGRASVALSPFSDAWKPAAEAAVFDAQENVDAAVAQLQQAGYNKENADGTPGEKLSLSLLVAEDSAFRERAAAALVVQLGKAGVDVTVEVLPHKDLTARLKQGRFDLYLGELRMTAAMSLDPWFRRGDAAYGVASGGAAATAYGQYLDGQAADVKAFADAFADDMPYIPLVWRDGAAVYRRGLNNVQATAFDPFYTVETWSYD